MLLAPLVLALAEASAPIALWQDPVVEVHPSVELRSNWTAGTKRALVLVKERQDETRGKSGPKVVSTTTLDFAVEAKDDAGFTTSWLYRTTKVDAGNPIASIVSTKVASAYEGWTLRLHHDPDGAVESIVDAEAARTKLLDLMDDVVETLAKQPNTKPKDAEVLRKAMEASKAVLDEATFAATVLKDPQMIFCWCGAALEVGRKVEYEDALPIPFASEPISTHASIELVRHDSQQGEAELEWHQVLDPEQTKTAIAATLGKLAEKLGKPPPTAAELPPFEIVDEGRWILDTTTGLPKDVVWTRRVHSEELVRTETLRASFQPVEVK